MNLSLKCPTDAFDFGRMKLFDQRLFPFIVNTVVKKSSILKYKNRSLLERRKASKDNLNV